MDSIITDYTDFCIMCAKPNTEPHHLINGRGKRQLSDDSKLIIPVCRECHELIHKDARVGNLAKVLGQIAWEKENNAGREDFIRKFGKSYT